VDISSVSRFVGAISVVAPALETLGHYPGREKIHEPAPDDLFAWEPVGVTEGVMQSGLQLATRLSLSWSDALIVAAAQGCRCRYLLTEDLQEGQVMMDDLQILNFFRRRPNEMNRDSEVACDRYSELARAGVVSTPTPVSEPMSDGHRLFQQNEQGQSGDPVEIHITPPRTADP